MTAPELSTFHIIRSHLTELGVDLNQVVDSLKGDGYYISFHMLHVYTEGLRLFLQVFPEATLVKRNSHTDLYQLNVPHAHSIIRKNKISQI
jgi:hypothetical protein